MKHFLLAFVATLACALGPGALAATYTYTGNTYAGANGAYNTGMSITGEFTTAAPLAANLVGQDISGLVLTFTFSDGVTTITDADGTLAAFNTIPGIQVSTDGSGDITAWAIFARDLPLATAINDVNSIISTINSGMIAVQDQGADDSICTAVNGVPSCTSYSPGTQGTGINFSNPGSWVTTLPPPPPPPPVVTEVPGLTGYGLALTGLGLLLVGLRRLRR